MFNSKQVIRVAMGAAVAAMVAVTASSIVQAQAPKPAVGVKYSQVNPADLKDWLTYLASDELQGRQIYTEGYGLAAGFVSEKLRSWGVKPLGTDGTYLQIVKNRGYNVTRNGTVTVEVGGQTRTFKQGEHVTFPANGGGKQTRVFSGVQYVGNTLAPGTNLKNKTVTIINASGGGRGGRNVAGNLASAAGATGTITFAPAPPTPSPAEAAITDSLAKAQQALTDAQTAARGGGGRGAGGFPGGGGGRGNALPAADVTTVQDMNAPAASVTFTGDETFFDFLYSGSDVKFNDLRARIDKGENVPSFELKAKVTVNVDNKYEVVSQQLAHNVVGMIEGTDPKLKDTYVLFGAHLDHVGYSAVGNGNVGSPSGCRNRSQAAYDAVKAAGKTPVKAPGGPGAAAGGGRGARAGGSAPDASRFDKGDFISNGADDDGSGSTALLGVAKAFATGPRPKRSVVFVWHVGEEAGLLGSRYNADFPIVPLEKTQAQLNMDMVGRDDCDDMEGDYTNSVFIVGADRISTDLHNIIVETNQTMVKPLGLDYEMNDPTDPESVYTRSDHYSYAAKGIPIAFFTTGLHPDYHRVTDTVDKILFPKMARITQLVYETGFSIANTDKVLERDNKGPRTGFGSKPEVIKK